MAIKVNRFKDYKVINTPETSQMVDNNINKQWWENEGWSIMYDLSFPEFKSKLSNWDFTRQLSDFESIQPTEESDKLQGVLDFLEKKEGKLNPLKDYERSKEMISNPKAIYVGKLGFAYINSMGDLTLFPYPASGRSLEDEGEIESYISDVKDGGVFIWDDALEQKFPDDYII